MAEKTFKLQILTPKKRVFQGEISSLVAPGALGYLGVLANHAPLVTTLTAGKVTYRDAQGQATSVESTGEGFLEVRNNQARLLADGIAQ